MARNIQIFLISAVTALLTVTVGYSINGPAHGGLAPRPNPTDPGVRSPATGVGGPFPKLSATEIANFNGAQVVYNSSWSVTGRVSGQVLPGLGPRYTAQGCWACHSQPTIGGSSPLTNNEVAAATISGATLATNPVPSGNYLVDGQPYIRINGPTRIAYQKSNGGVLQPYRIVGMTDAPGTCTSSALPQIDFNSLLAANDITPHIPIPIYGLGLVEATLNANRVSQINVTKNNAWGINARTSGNGRFNYDGVGTISRFGWKGGSPSSFHFAGLAHGVDIGNTDELFPQKTTEVAACIGVPQPEDHAQVTSRGNCGGCAMDYASTTTADSYFGSHMDAPTPVWGSYSSSPPSGWNGSSTAAYSTATVSGITQGQVYDGYQQFIAIGCDTCHVPSHTTGPNVLLGNPNFNNFAYYHWSDDALHAMGDGLNDGIRQGAAGPADFRTPPLWGSGLRIWFMHDGRTNDIGQAILAHCSSNSEAAAVCSAYQNTLTPTQQQDLVYFLRGL